MKLILAIVHNDDGPSVTSALTREGYFVTRLSTTGGFLLVGNTTLLIGTEDTRVERAIEILEKFCTTRTDSSLDDRPTNGNMAGCWLVCPDGSYAPIFWFLKGLNDGKNYMEKTPLLRLEVLE